MTAPPSLFGEHVRQADADVLVLPVPFDATASYRTGSAGGPAAIAAASGQVDDADPHLGDLLRARTAMLEPDDSIARLSRQTRARVEHFRGSPDGGSPDGSARGDPAGIEEACEHVRAFVRAQVERTLGGERTPAVVGGEHGVSLGAIEACARAFPGLGVLQIDAHMDLRSAYQGLRYSHASVMRNVLDDVPGVERLVQVGIRDFAPEEAEAAGRAGQRVETFFDPLDGLDEGAAGRIAAALPASIYISLDIDGLDPALCPNTGTPVPGGLTWRELTRLLVAIRDAGKRLVGFDLVEVAPAPGVTPAEDWNAIVGARTLQRLCSLAPQRTA